MAVFQAGLSKPSSPWPWEALKKRVRSGRLSAGEVERLMEGLVIWVQGDHPDRYHSSLDNLAHFLDELDDQDLISEHDKLEFLTALYGTLEIRPLPRLRQGQRSVTLSGDWSFFWHHRKLFGLDFLTEMGTVAIDGEIIDLSERGHSAAFNPHSFYGKVPLPDLTPGGHQNEGTGTALHVTSGWILFS
jgi:hypothetical protein